MKNPLLVLSKRKKCLEGCGYDKSMGYAVDNGILLLPLSVESLKAAFPKSFSRHQHKCEITMKVELL